MNDIHDKIINLLKHDFYAHASPSNGPKADIELVSAEFINDNTLTYTTKALSKKCSPQTLIYISCYRDCTAGYNTDFKILNPHDMNTCEVKIEKVIDISYYKELFEKEEHWLKTVMKLKKCLTDRKIKSYSSVLTINGDIHKNINEADINNVLAEIDTKNISLHYLLYEIFNSKNERIDFNTIDVNNIDSIEIVYNEDSLEINKYVETKRKNKIIRTESCKTTFNF